MFPAPPEAVSKYFLHTFFNYCLNFFNIQLIFIYVFLGFTEGYLNVYSETHVDIFDVATGEWLQTLNIKKVCCF